MPSYISNLLKNLNFKIRKSIQLSFPLTSYSYTKIQYISQKLLSYYYQKKYSHSKVTKSFLYYTQSLDNLLQAGLNNIAIDISTVDNIILSNIICIINYIATNPNQKIICKHSNIILNDYSDIISLCHKARS